MKVLQVLVFILLMVSFAHSQNVTISGSVNFEKEKIEGVIIKAVESNGKVFEAKTDFEGKYKLLLPKGLFTVTLNHCAYEFEELKININSTRNLVFDFQPKFYITHSCNLDEREVEVGFTPISKKLLIVEKSILTGSVYDAYGALIIGAKITAINEKGEKFETLTNNDGIYILNLPYNPYRPESIDFKIAKYEVVVEKENFEKTIIKNFKFAPSYTGKVNLDFAMDVFVNINTITIQKDKNNKEEK